jgi:hypothetical protein
MDTPSGVKGSILSCIKFSVQVPDKIPYNGIYYDPPEEICSNFYLAFFSKLSFNAMYYHFMIH